MRASDKFIGGDESEAAFFKIYVEMRIRGIVSVPAVYNDAVDASEGNGNVLNKAEIVLAGAFLIFGIDLYLSVDIKLLCGIRAHPEFFVA